MNIETIVHVSMRRVSYTRSLAGLHEEVDGWLALLERVDVSVEPVLLGEFALNVVRALALRQLGCATHAKKLNGESGFGPGLAHAAASALEASAHFFQS